jgi:hypothetical protein
MPGKGSKIIADDYNAIQKRVAAVLGAGGTNPSNDLADDTFGYGQTASSSQVSQFAKISTTQWVNLRNDLLRCRYHQNADVSAILTTPLTSTTITEADRAQYLSVAENAITNRLATPPDTQIDVIPIVATNLSQWNTQITQTVTVTFSNTTQARYFFNAGGSLRISSSRANDAGDGSYSLKNATWTTMLNSMGKISLNRSTTTRSGTTGTTSNIGWAQLTTSDQLIFEQLAPGTTYSDNKFRIFAKLASANTQIVFSIQWRDDSPNPNTTLYGLYGPFGVDELVTGILTSTLEVLKPSGLYVSVTAPTVTQSGFGTVPSPPASIIYQISPSVTVMDEGTPVTFNISTANFGSGRLYWTNTGTTEAADFTDGLNSGFVDINGNIGSLTRNLVNDFSTEGTQTIIINLHTGSTSGDIVKTAATVSVLDSSKSLGYNIVPDQFFATETTTCTWTVTTTNFPDGNLYWTNSGTAQGVDFSGGNNSGIVPIVSNRGTITLYPKADLLTEPGGDETIIINLRTGSTSGDIVKTALPVQLQDTSQTPPPIVIPPVPTPDPPPPPASIVSIVISANGYDNITSVSENSGDITYTITTANFRDGPLYWTNGGTTTAADFTDGSNSGTMTISSNQGTLVRRLLNDAVVDPNETIIIRFHTGSTSGPILKTANQVTIIDSTPVPPPPPGFDFTVSPITGSAFIGGGFNSVTTTAQFTINCTSGSGGITVSSLILDSGCTTGADGGLTYTLSNPGTTYQIVNIACKGAFGAGSRGEFIYQFGIQSADGTIRKFFTYTQVRFNEVLTLDSSTGQITQDPDTGEYYFDAAYTITGGEPGARATGNQGFDQILNNQGGARAAWRITAAGVYTLTFVFPSGHERSATITVTQGIILSPPDSPPDTGGG